MSENGAPFIRLGEDADEAPRLNYSIPESTNHVGVSVISIDIDENFLNAATLKELRENVEKKKVKRPKPVGPDLRIDNLTLVSKSDRLATVNNFKAVAEVYEQYPSSFIYTPSEGMLGFSGDFDIIQPKPRPPSRVFPKILFFEKLQISTFLGNYGAGRVIKTFSLFPGEKTKISLKTYQKTIQQNESKVNFGSSVLDSVTEEAAVDFENSIQSESSNKYTETEADILNSQKNYSKKEGSGNAKVLWGLVEAGGSGGSESSEEVSGEWGTRSARESFANTVSNALFKHSARASSKRDVEINTSQEQSVSTTSEKGSESTIERQIENVNVSRTLNLVFRQMVQEYISVLHLTDVKIALYDESPGPYPQYAIHELDKFLDAYFIDDPETRTSILSGIIRELYFIFDYRDTPQQFLEQVNLEFPATVIAGLNINLPESVSYLRVNKSLKTRLEGREFIEVPGVVLKENVITMRTDGVVVDGFLGRGGDPEAGLLDTYSASLQTETIREMALKNSLQQEEISRIALGRDVVANGDEQQAERFRKVFCCEPEAEKESEQGGRDDNDT
ncbi:hypothetical protein [Nitrosomonas sp.]|uniref:hypothetical protein n=1 Tax=Nitrosomonas sp. TaxID=42353 RepID=UPI001D50E688|nr:hypothetical protein [Nitrosomonas sp.]MBX3615720.1 hypothetical protein [Nitrosomonas sp.]